MRCRRDFVEFLSAMLDFWEELYKPQRKSCRAGNLEAVNVKEKIPPKIWIIIFFCRSMFLRESLRLQLNATETNLRPG